MGLGVLITVNNKPNEGLTGQVSTIEVVEKIDQPTTYKIRFMVDVCDQDIAKNLEENTDPDSVLGVLAEVDDQLVCLVTGKVTKQEAHLEHGGAGSWVDVEGTDTSADMDKTPVNKVWVDNDSDIVSGILGSNKMIPDVESTPESAHEEDKHSLPQREADLSFIRRLAQRNGFHFWVTYDSQGNATGHFRSRSLQGTAAADLTVNLEKSNMDNLQIRWDIRRPTENNGTQVSLTDKQIIGGRVTLSDSQTLGAKALPDIAGNSAHSAQVSPTADDGGAMHSRSQAVLRDAQWFISATSQTSLNRLCKIVRSHTLVNVQGAGSRHSGKYYVTGVKHTINALSHVMDLELARNAWGDQGLTPPVNKIF